MAIKKEYNPKSAELQSWKNMLRRLGLDTQKLIFTSKGLLKEITLNGRDYYIE